METHLLHLAAGLDRLRFTPVICCLCAGVDYVRRIDALGLDHYDLRAPTLTSLRNLTRLRGLVGILARHRPRIIHTYGYTCDVLGPLAGKILAGARVITTRRGEDRAVRHQRWRSRMNRFADRVICVSDATAEFTRRTENLHGTEIDVIPNGVAAPEGRLRSTDPRLPPNRPLRFGTLGTVKPVKGTDLLVDAFLRLDPDLSCELRIGGRTDAGEWGGELVRRVRESPRADRIHFDGYQSDPWRFYDGIDVFVLPSRSEGMSNSLLEAMAVGLPCLVTDVGSSAAVVAPAGGSRPGGLVTTPDVEGLFRVMRRAVEDPQAREEWAAGARELAERNHSMRVMVSRHEAVYRELIRNDDS